jgi:hypothetical protein
MVEQASMAVSSGKSQAVVGQRDDATLLLTTEADGRQSLELILGNNAAEEAKLYSCGKTEAELKAPHLLADYDPNLRILVTYPTITSRGTTRFLESKYDFEWIAFDGMSPIKPADDEPRGV